MSLSPCYDAIEQARRDLRMANGGDGIRWYLTREFQERFIAEVRANGSFVYRRGDEPEIDMLLAVPVLTSRHGQGNELHGERLQKIIFATPENPR